MRSRDHRNPTRHLCDREQNKGAPEGCFVKHEDSEGTSVLKLALIIVGPDREIKDDLRTKNKRSHGIK